MSEYFGFEYFCGANVLVRIGDMPLLEASGLSYSIQETKRPIYGYSSRFFDTVARGQVLVQGQLAINYVHQDYLYHAIRAGLGLISNEAPAPKINTPEIQDYMSSLGENSELDGQFIQALKNQFWSNPLGTKGYTVLSDTRNPHDNGSGVNLHVTFGDQDLGFKNSGKTGILISNVHFNGRGSVIKIDEDVIVETYSFIARNIYSLKANAYELSKTVEIDPSEPNFGETLTLQQN